MVTLNSGFSVAVSTTDKITKEEHDAIAAFYAAGGKVTKCPPAGASGNESVRATNEFIAKKRREFRAKQRAAAKRARGGN